LALCLSFVLALQPSDRRRAEPFQQELSRVHLNNIGGKHSNFLNYAPSVDTECSHAIALDIAAQALGFPATFNVKNSYVTSHNNVRHVYLKQTADDGREIFNADLNINVRNKRATNIGHTFFNGSTAPVKGNLASWEVLKHFLAFVKADAQGSKFQVFDGPTGIDMAHKINGIEGAESPAIVRAGYVQVANENRLEPVWDIQLDMGLSWWNARVSMRDGKVMELFDWVNDVNTYEVYPIGVNDPDDGSRVEVFIPERSPSPLGWHNQGNGTVYAVTIGNNVYTQSNPSGGSSYLDNPRPYGSFSQDYIFPVDFSTQPVAYVNASTANLFVWNNYIHDIFYEYGFDEISGNFQENNWNRGGLQNDAVIANCQDGSGTNNANFFTPPDGQKPRMRMYIWTLSTPSRDGDLEDGIIIHEYAHGISNRLTGGPNNVGCLSGGEAGGMGEGWGDFFATFIRQRDYYNRDTPFPMGAYSANNPKGIRKYLYTTDFDVNPETYAFINNSTYSGVHAKGEVWCTILWQVYWNFVEEYGFSADLYRGQGGNNRLLLDIVDGMKLQPCNPNFVDARNAILLADELNFGGQDSCLLWKGFAARGLGEFAVGGKSGANIVKEDFTVPEACL